MIEKRLLRPDRARKIAGSFATIEHRFLREGFWAELSHHELILYLFLIVVGDRHGLSYYSYDRICSLTGLLADEYILARDGLIHKDLIAFDGRLFQVLSLPCGSRTDRATVRQLIHQSLGGDHDHKTHRF
ncbi:conserved hypothetical protein [uncultured Desulfatiglans sp.]|uniref:Uncharacterized protein n=1 Tax=Uncultured Desulfatiglans sp. TaxID=1748965 RepID=A0A653A6K0_UNCDX|nr:conserved hypothetical protein [uncultured Desulfatiglans sp.]